MTRAVILVSLATVLVLGSEGKARAQTPPVCPDKRELLVSEPPTHVRAGAALAFSVSRDDDAVTEVDVTYPGTEGPQSERFVFPPDEDEIEVIRPMPSGVKSFDLEFVWQQNVGRPNACTGSDRYVGIPIVGRTARVGRPGVARLAGRYRAKYSNGDSARWTLRPSCDVFGCATSLRSSGGSRGTLRPQEDGSYELERREAKVAECRLEFGDGSTRTYGIYGYVRYTVRVRRTRARDKVALELVGRRTYWESAPSDELDLCQVPERRQTHRLSLRRTAP